MCPKVISEHHKGDRPPGNECKWVSEEKITHIKLGEQCLETVVMPGGCGIVSRYNTLLPFFHAIVDSLFPLGTGNRWVS